MIKEEPRIIQLKVKESCKSKDTLTKRNSRGVGDQRRDVTTDDGYDEQECCGISFAKDKNWKSFNVLHR